jgi:hypothetical protein
VTVNVHQRQNRKQLVKEREKVDEQTERCLEALPLGEKKDETMARAR